MEPLCPPENQGYGAPVVQAPPYQGPPPGQPPYQGPPPGQPLYQGPPPGQPPYQGPPPGQPPYQGPPPGQPTPVVVNQTTPVVVNTAFPQEMFKLSPVTVACPFCHNTVSTEVKTSCDCGACCLFCITTLLFYVIIQLVRGKDLCCQDAEHICPNCKQVIARYSAC